MNTPVEIVGITIIAFLTMFGWYYIWGYLFVEIFDKDNPVRLIGRMIGYFPLIMLVCCSIPSFILERLF